MLARFGDGAVAVAALPDLAARSGGAYRIASEAQARGTASARPALLEFEIARRLTRHAGGRVSLA